MVLDFWAEWCGPCRNDLPVLSGVDKNRAENGLVVVDRQGKIVKGE